MLAASWELFMPSDENELTLQQERRSQRPVQWMLLTLLTPRPISSYSRLPKVLSSLNATFHNSWAWTILAGCRFWTVLTFVCSDPPPTKGLASVGKKSLIRAIEERKRECREHREIRGRAVALCWKDLLTHPAYNLHCDEDYKDVCKTCHDWSSWAYIHSEFSIISFFYK